MLACSTLVWCHPPSQAMLLEGGTVEPLLKGLNAAFVRLSSDQAQPHHTVTYQALLLLVLNV